MKVKAPTSQILVEFHTIEEHLISLPHGINVAAVQENAEIKSFSVSTRPAFLFQLAHRAPFKIFESCNSIGHVQTPKPNFEDPRIDQILNPIKTKDQFFNLRIDGILVGPDLLETYLREYNEPYLKVGDPRLRELIAWALIAISFWKTYFKENNVRALFLSHGIYRYGVMTQIALAMNVSCYHMTVRGLFRLHPGSKLGLMDFKSFPKLFSELDPETQNQGIEWAKGRLSRRFSAEVGVDMPYSSKSAYTGFDPSKRVLRDSKKHKVVIATHCFFDNPHFYGGMLFPDFAEWVEFVGDCAHQTDFDWYLKTHPDYLEGTQAAVSEILSRYPKIVQIPASTSWHQLAAEGVKTVLTVYGSVGHELPLLGINVVTAGDNPHDAYTFNKHCKSLEEFRNVLLNLDTLKIEVVPRDVYEFYYLIHRLYIVDRFVLPSHSKMTADLTFAGRNSPEIYAYFLKHFDEKLHQDVLARIDWFFRNKQERFFMEHRYLKSLGAT